MKPHPRCGSGVRQIFAYPISRRRTLHKPKRYRSGKSLTENHLNVAKHRVVSFTDNKQLNDADITIANVPLDTCTNAAVPSIVYLWKVPPKSLTERPGLGNTELCPPTDITVTTPINRYSRTLTVWYRWFACALNRPALSPHATDIPVSELGRFSSDREGTSSPCLPLLSTSACLLICVTGEKLSVRRRFQIVMAEASTGVK